MKNNIPRRAELSQKFLVMGQSLMKEGAESKDYAVTQSGTMMILVGSLLLDDNDMFIFSELCAMFSAKKILDSTEGANPLENEMFAKILKERDKKFKASNTPVKKAAAKKSATKTPTKKGSTRRGSKPKSDEE